MTMRTFGGISNGPQAFQHQGCQIFLDPNITKRKNILNDHKLYRTETCYKKFHMVIKHTNIFHSKAIQNLPKLV
jgi:hypothetical protein